LSPRTRPEPLKAGDREFVMFVCPSTYPKPFPSRRVRAADPTRHAELADKFGEVDPYANLSPGEAGWLKERDIEDPGGRSGMFHHGDGAVLVGTLKGFDDWYNAENVEQGIRYHPSKEGRPLSGIQARFYTEDNYQGAGSLGPEPTWVIDERGDLGSTNAQLEEAEVMPFADPRSANPGYVGCVAEDEQVARPELEQLSDEETRIAEAEAEILSMSVSPHELLT